ncbi:MAG: hypothetical protein FJ301_10840 [Planctomycetes bacterium]|nr:hypothetical protein [Planctomycetota bacterium]
MEDKVFPSPAVAGLMKRFVVESRQHTDTKNTLTDEQFAMNRKAQAEIAGSKANPYFVIVDPRTGEKIDTFRLTGSFTEWEGLWKAWLEGVLAKTDRSK